MDSLKGCTALVTGASSGIGEAFAKELARTGTNLILTARSTDKLKVLQQSLSQQHQVNVEAIPADLSDPTAAKALYGKVQEKGICIDLLINNAGFGKWGMFLDFDPACYHAMLTLNINSLVELTHLFLPAMIEKRGRGVINVGSTASFIPVPYSTVYGASKAFVLMFSEALYAELEDTGVHVMALCPGGTDTNFANVANSSVNTKGLEWDSAESVAVYGIEQFLLGTPSCIAGKQNRKVALLPRLLSRPRVIKMAKKTWGGMLKARGLKPVHTVAHQAKS